jgi:hypothetical protein
MRKEFRYRDISPRSERNNKLKRKLERITSFLKENNYDNSSVLFEDLNIFLNTEKEIQIQESYLKLEEMYYNGDLA